jgi:PAS domain S-box-containing protein
MAGLGSDSTNILEGARFSNAQWRDNFLKIILRSAALLGLIAAVVSGLDVYRAGQVGLAAFYAAAWLLLLILAIPPWPYRLKALGLLALIYAVAISGLLENGMRGDARLFFLTAVIMAAMLFNPRAGAAALTASLITIAAAAALIFSGQIHLSSKVTPAGDLVLWLVSSLSLALAATTVLIGISLFLREFSRAEDRVQQALRQVAGDRALLRTVMDNLPDAVYAKDLSGRKTLTNPADVRTMGAHSAAQVLGKTDHEFFSAELADKFSAHDRQILETGQPRFDDEQHFTDADGQTRWLATAKLPLRDPAGRVIGLVGIGHDITERRQSEQALRESESKFRSFVEESSEGIVLTDEDGRIIEWNRAFEELTGLGHADIGQLMVWDAQFQSIAPDRRTPEHYQQLRAAALDMLQGGQLPASAASVESAVQTAGGEQRYLLQSVFPIRTGKGFRIGAVLRDNTRRRQIEEIERRRRESLEKIVELGKAVAAITDFDQCLRRIHYSIQTGLGFDRVGLFLYDAGSQTIQGALGTDRSGGLVDLSDYTTAVTDADAWQVALQSPLGINLINDYDVYHDRPPGSEMAGVKQHVTLAAWTGEAPVALITADNLISQRPFTPEDLEALQLFAGYAGLAIQNARWNAEMEARVRERTRQLEDANAELESFSYSISHDLRTPLRSINGFSQVLLTDYGPRLPAEAQDFLTRVSAGALRMNQLIDDLLAFSRLGRQPLQTQPVDPAQLAREAWEEVWPRTRERPPEFAIGDLPGCEADPALLRQVWTNLLGNAVKYSSRQTDPRIEIGWRDGAYFVRDNGVGFDTAQAGKLFGVFQRLHAADEFEGTGIGLANVKRIITRHGGRVWAEARAGQGATFFFTVKGQGAEG